MIKNGHFKKTYIVKVDIDLEAVHYDTEWAIENYETNGQLGYFLGRIEEELDKEIKELKQKEE